MLQGRENSGPSSLNKLISPFFYKNLKLLKRTKGHFAPVNCVVFDQKGKFIITGAADMIVKKWSAINGRLLATFRGANGEIMDIAVNFDNTLLAAGSLDKIIRVWCFQTMSPVQNIIHIKCGLCNSTFKILNLKFFRLLCYLDIQVK